MTTADATGIGQTGATLSATYSGASESPREVGFEWGTSASDLSNELYVDTGSGTSGSFSTELTGLSTSTTYYYRAFILVGTDKYYYGGVKSFTTKSDSATDDLGYLANYEVPAVDFNGKVVSGNELTGRGYKWYRYMTTNPMQAVATHTYMESGKVIRNYTVLLDGDKKSPLWSACAMHSQMWPDNNVGRNDSWTEDPAFTGLGDWQNTGVSSPYSKGHLVASNDRQSSTEANKQTFYYSNQAPQYQTQFNDGVWNSLELAINANLPSGRDTLYVVTGVLYEGNQYSGSVQIPSHFYKCVMKCSFNTSGAMTAAKGVAYLYSNERHTDAKYYDSEFVTTIDAVEQRAGFDFFANVPKTYQDAAESTKISLY